jgi:pSer/pThr/pTyr-binding forkhead associated (FHA) protein
MVAKFSADPGLRIRLQYNDKVLSEISAGEISLEIEIGRSSSCTWRVPHEDALISSHHAVLVRQGRIVVLRDKGSKNGTWFQGKRIEERKLKAGDRISLGHCVLAVELETEETQAKAVAELEVLTGNHRHERKPIQAEKLTIGTAPDSDLLLTDDLVSRNHAVLVRKGEDSYWLRAFNTTNGTKVNDVPLRAEQERLLKDGDRIAVAHVEIIFRDGSNRRDHGQALRRLAVMALAGVLVVALYFGWQLIRAPAAAAVRKAQALKESGHFAQAKMLLDGAINRRGYRDVQINADLLRSQLSKCASSSMQWQTVQEHLQQQDWTNAAAQLGTLLALYNDNDAWGWHEGPAVRERAHQIKGWLDAYLEAGHPESLSSSALEECDQQLAATITELKSQQDSQKYYQNLLTAEIERHNKLSQFLKSISGLNHALQQLRQPGPLPDPNPILKEIEKIAANSTGPVRQKAEDVLPLLRQLVASYNKLLQALRNAQEMHFKEAQALNPDLPLPDECMLDNNLFEFRRNLENSWAHFVAELPTVAHLTEALANRLGSAESEPVELLYWREGQTLTKVFQCDSLAGRFPKRTRTEPQGEYDRALCVEWFYSSLRAIIDQRGDEIQEPPFESRLGATLRTVEAAKALVRFLPTPTDKPYWQNGQIKQWVDAARRVLQLRDNIASEMRQRAQQASGREALIAGGIAWQLMDTPDKPFRETLAGQWTSLRKSVLALNNQWDNVTSAEKKIELRKKILSIGLPGDPVVNQMWIESNGSGAGAAGQ